MKCDNFKKQETIVYKNSFKNAVNTSLFAVKQIYVLNKFKLY